MEGGLAYGQSCVLGEEADLIYFEHAFVEPLPLSVTAVVGLRKYGVPVNGTIEQTAGVGHAHEKARAAILGDGEEVLGRVLLEDAVDDLEGGNRSLLHGGLTLFEPADVGAEAHAIVANLPFLLQVFQGLENVVTLNDVNAGIVELVDIYPVGLKTLKTLFTGLSDELGLEVLRFLFVSDAGGEGIEVVADLAAENDIVALALQGLGDHFLVGAGSCIGRRYRRG